MTILIMFKTYIVLLNCRAVFSGCQRHKHKQHNIKDNFSLKVYANKLNLLLFYALACVRSLLLVVMSTLMSHTSLHFFVLSFVFGLCLCLCR